MIQTMMEFRISRSKLVRVDEIMEWHIGMDTLAYLFIHAFGGGNMTEVLLVPEVSREREK